MQTAWEGPMHLLLLLAVACGCATLARLLCLVLDWADAQLVGPLTPPVACQPCDSSSAVLAQGAALLQFFTSRPAPRSLTFAYIHAACRCLVA